MILDSVISAHVEQRAGQALAASATWQIFVWKHQTLRPAQDDVVSLCPSSTNNSGANFWLRLSMLLELLLMEFDTLHCLLGHSINTPSSKLRAHREHCSSVRSQKSPSFPILGLYGQHLFESPAVLPSFHYVAQNICKVSAKTLPLIHKGSIWGLSLGNFWNIKLFWTILCCLKKIALHILSISD